MAPSVNFYLALNVAVVSALLMTGNLHVPLPSAARGQLARSVPRDVYPWRPSALDPAGPYAPNAKLAAATRLFEGQIHGAESLTFAPDGRLIMLDKHGIVWQANASLSAPGGYALDPAPIAQLPPGRPLGARFDAGGNLIFCSTHLGLAMLPAGSRQPVVLASHVAASSPTHAGRRLVMANGLDIAADGKVLFTVSSDLLPPLTPRGDADLPRAWELDLLRGDPKGLVLEYDPATKEAVVIAGGLRFANGLALSRDGSYAVVAETNRLALTKVELTGRRRGRVSTLIDRLPGAPDGVSRASDGGFYVALVAAPPLPVTLLPFRWPLMRTLIAWVSEFVALPVDFRGAVVKVTPAGTVAGFRADLTAQRVASVSAVEERGGRLFMANLVGDYVSVMDLSK